MEEGKHANVYVSNVIRPLSQCADYSDYTMVTVLFEQLTGCIDLLEDCNKLKWIIADLDANKFMMGCGQED